MKWCSSQLITVHLIPSFSSLPFLCTWKLPAELRSFSSANRIASRSDAKTDPVKPYSPVESTRSHVSEKACVALTLSSYTCTTSTGPNSSVLMSLCALFVVAYTVGCTKKPLDLSALHSIAAHLQRYLSELKSLRGIAADLSADHASVHENDAKPGNKEALKQAARGFAQVLSQVDAAHELAVELEKKTQNILALLFNRIQISSDRLLVANGEAMQGILRAMQEDASLAQRMATESHRLAQEMKKDSIAMKTIAIVTMFFLPGATFATLLSMPFFSDNEWMGHASRFWIWVVFSVPSTVACFIFYSIWRKRAQELVREAEDGVPLQGLPNIRQNGHVR
ncbi:hypothetical protein BN1723_000085 [Verticillium longisporum]|uniref:Fungal N-terminal domain-containing protein n=1 Tax=Verticillium longisporum TaxID=100787 RepID=A0A0G4KE14_VERLO|nr:hypothetical protein BN1723_000085 [Verticillium longisporum]